MSAPSIDVIATVNELTDHIAGHAKSLGIRVQEREGDRIVHSPDKRQGRRIVLALMTIEDTERAIRAFRKPRLRRLPAAEARKRQSEDPDWAWPGTGTAYLTTYGLLQAMQLQQLAAETVAIGLGLSELKLDTTNIPRVARHNAAGHPFSDHGEREDHFLDRSSVFENTLNIVSFAPGGEWSGRAEHIPDLKRLQGQLIVGFLAEIMEAIDARHTQEG